jgi:CRP-like cAMP-binding protein
MAVGNEEIGRLSQSPTEPHANTRNGIKKRQAAIGPLRMIGVEESIPISFSGELFNRLLNSLEGDDIARLLPHMEFVSLFGGQEVQAFGDTPEFAVFPETAVLSHVYFLNDGSSTGAAIVGNDGLVGLSAILSSAQVPRWVYVVIGGTAVRVPLSIIKQEFARATMFQRLLFSYTNARLLQLSQRAVCNGRHTLSQRLCTWLLMVRDRTRLEQLPLTHEQIAMQLGARRAGVTNACNTLKDRGILSYKRGLIRILDRDRLQTAACECYGVLKLGDRAGC